MLSFTTFCLLVCQKEPFCKSCNFKEEYFFAFLNLLSIILTILYIFEVNFQWIAVNLQNLLPSENSAAQYALLNKLADVV